MVTIKNKKTGIPKNENENADYAFLIEQCLNYSPDGFSYADYKMRERIQQVLNYATSKKKETLSFEDADYDNLKNIVKKMRWAQFKPEINEFLDYILEALPSKETDESPKEAKE